jgi:hypothetical protein
MIVLFFFFFFYIYLKYLHLQQPPSDDDEKKDGRIWDWINWIGIITIIGIIMLPEEIIIPLPPVPTCPPRRLLKNNR